MLDHIRTPHGSEMDSADTQPFELTQRILRKRSRTAKPSWKRLCPTNWAKKIRNFQKLGWKLPIPRYDAKDPHHVRLSELGATAEQECNVLTAECDIMTNPAGDAQSRAGRKLLRHEWQPNSTTDQAIQVAVAKLLSDPKQAELAKQQMEKGQSCRRWT